MSFPRLKLLILAIDGLDPDLLTKWWDQLPNLTAMAKSSRFSRLRSTVPPMTFPAWSTFLTGVNPAAHGIFDFTERLDGKMGVRFLNATRRRYPTFLKLLSQAGIRVASVGIPTTYPPEPLSGFQISGFDSPLPSKADRSYIYPPELADGIESHLGGYYFGDFNESRIGKSWHANIFKKLLNGIDRKKALFHFLLENHPVDALVFYIGETDTVGHHFWALCDPHSPRFVAPQDKALRTAIRDVYRAADDLIGDACHFSQPEAVLIVSDHGMGGTSDRMLYLNRFLEEQGFLEFTGSSAVSKVVSNLKHIGMRWMPYRWQRQVFRWANGNIAANIESWQRFGSINWNHTLAFSEELNYFPSIWLNVQGRDPFGVIPQDDVERVVERLTRALRQWMDPLSQTAIVKKVHRRAELYHGSEIAYAPDLILELNQPDNYSYALGRSSSPLADRPWRRLTSNEYLGFKGGTMNGSHRHFGTLILNAATDCLQPIENPMLSDIAPTVLDLFGLEKPEWMEGISLLSDQQPVTRREPFRNHQTNYTEMEERRLRERLIKLGYLG